MLGSPAPGAASSGERPLPEESTPETRLSRKRSRAAMRARMDLSDDDEDEDVLREGERVRERGRE